MVGRFVNNPGISLHFPYPRGVLLPADMNPSYTKDRDALLTRLNRIEGQVRGISRMVEEQAYCIDVLTQINAIKAAIDQVGFLLLEDHIKGCVATAVRQGDQSKVNELVKAVERFAKA